MDLDVATRPDSVKAAPRTPSRIRSFILVTHRWMGLASSLALAIVGLTGAILLLPGKSPLRSIAGPLHERLGMGKFGWWIVVVVTIAAVFLELGGLYLWWKRKTISVRMRAGWRLALFDLHHAFGVLALPLMLLLAVSGVGMAFVTPKNQPQLRRVIFDLHTTRGFSTSVKVVYALGTTGFLLQGVTGVAMWCKPRRLAS